MAIAERRFTSDDENYFRVEYLEAHPAIEDEDDVVFRHTGDTGAIVEVSAQMVTKTHVSLGAYDREQRALTFVARQNIGGVPRLLADNRSARRLTLERILGVSVEQSSALYTPALWHMAGAWLRSLHAQPGRASDAMSFGQAMGARLDASLEITRELLSGDALRVVEAMRASLSKARFSGTERVFCHRDYRPRNWMLRRDGTFVAVDFEHARVDFLETDFARLVPWFRERPDLRDVFMKSYRDARRVYSDERLRVALVVDALQTLAWGVRHLHEGYRNAGEALVEAALDEYEKGVSWLYPTRDTP